MIITRTPFRISFFGGGTDLPDYYRNHEGEVLSTTIDKYLYITCRHLSPYWDYKHQFYYGARTEYITDIDEILHPSIRETMRFVNPQQGIDMHYNTDIPSKSGIGSSSSFTVGFLNALNGLEGKMTSKEKLLSDSLYIEQEMIREPVGSQDQAAAAYGGLNHIIFRKNGDIEVHPIVVSKSRIDELNANMVLVFTGFQRFSKDIEEKKIQNIESRLTELHEIKKYVGQALEILNSNRNLNEFGALLNDTWNRKKKLSDNVSDERIDGLYELGMKNGAIGGKLLGAGGGGFMLFYVEKDKKAMLLDAMRGKVCVPFHFEDTGSQVIYYKPEDES